MDTLEIHLLGNFRLTYLENPVTTVNTSRLQSLLAYLVLHRESPIPRQRLAFLLWPDSEEAQARTNLRNLIHILRLALPDADRYICTDVKTVQWEPRAGFKLDVRELECAAATQEFEKVVGLYAGDLLPDIYDEWLIHKREELRQIYTRALGQLISQKESGKDYATAIQYACKLLRQEPLQEQIYRDLMHLYALTGDPSGVKRTYNACVTTLQNEIGVTPSFKTQEVYSHSLQLLLQSIPPETASPSAPKVYATPIRTEDLCDGTLALVLAGGRSKEFNVLVNEAVKPALPFAGKYCLIDFVLSNLIRSNLKHFAILTQSNSQLLENLMDSEFQIPDPWQPIGFHLWEPSPERTGCRHYLGTADAVYQNRNFIHLEGCDNLLILSGEHLYHQDYRDLLRFHQEKKADLTISVTQVPPRDAHRFGIVEVDREQRILHFMEKPKLPRNTLASLGIYVFKTSFLLDCLEKDACNLASNHDFGASIIPFLTRSSKVYAYRHNGSWTDINTLDAYWKANLSILDHDPNIISSLTWNLDQPAGSTASAEIRSTGTVTNSIIAGQCLIEGEVIHSILFPGTHIERNAIVRDSVLLNHSVVHFGAQMNQCLAGSHVEIGANSCIGAAGFPSGQSQAAVHPAVTVIGREAHIPAGMIVGRNCYLDECVTEKDFGQLQIPDGARIRRRE